jgi:hypothetical protein
MAPRTPDDVHGSYAVPAMAVSDSGGEAPAQPENPWPAGHVAMPSNH